MSSYSKQIRVTIKRTTEDGRVSECSVQCLGCNLYLLPLRNTVKFEEATRITAKHPAPADVTSAEFNSLRDFYARCPNHGRVYVFNEKMEPAA